jgi:hypothetical protein
MNHARPALNMQKKGPIRNGGGAVFSGGILPGDKIYYSMNLRGAYNGSSFFMSPSFTSPSFTPFPSSGMKNPRNNIFHKEKEKL